CASVCSLTIFFFQAEDGIRYFHVTGVQTCALPIYLLHRQLEAFLDCVVHHAEGSFHLAAPRQDVGVLHHRPLFLLALDHLSNQGRILRADVGLIRPLPRGKALIASPTTWAMRLGSRLISRRRSEEHTSE